MYIPKLEIFVDEDCIIKFDTSFTEYVDVDKDFKLWFKNTGNTDLVDIELKNNIPDSILKVDIKELRVNEVVSGFIKWEGHEGKRKGQIGIKAKSIGVD